MVRDFSQVKKEELYKALDLIDDREWKPFMEWCSGRAAEFGVWADRLGISSYTRQIDNYQDKVLDTNSYTRNQIDVIFENVAETDCRYAEIFRGHAETVRGQIKRVQTMIQVMQSANRNGTEIKMIAYGIDPLAEVSYEEKLENGRRVLESYLRVRGITDTAEQQRICDLIMERQPNMLINLYISDYNSMAANKVYDLIMDYYRNHKNDRELEYAEGLLDNYLESKGYTNSVERQFIISMIREEQPQWLLNLYYTNIYSTASYNTILENIKNYYIENKENIGLEVIEERFRNDENADQYGVVCGYLELLLDLHYICKAEYDQYISGMGEGRSISSEKKEEICEFMIERKKFIESFESSKIMPNGVEDDKWTREQIMCALQIEAELKKIGYDDEFIAGLIGNVKNEGGFGVLEWVNSNGKRNEKSMKYWIHMIECIDYFNLYNKKKLSDIDLIQLYMDLIYKRENGDCTNTDEHKIGIGAVQWTEQNRSKKLMGFYLEQAGYDMNSSQFNEFIQEWINSSSRNAVYLTEEQIRDAEINMIIYELTTDEKNGGFASIYRNYLEERSNDNQAALQEATRIIMKEYERPSGDSFDERYASAQRWYETLNSQ